MRRYLLIAIPITISLAINGQTGFRRSAPAEVLKRLTAARSDIEKAGLLLDLSLAFLDRPGDELHDLDSAILLARQAERIGTQAGAKQLEAKANFILAGAFRGKGSHDSARHFIATSIQLYETLSLPAELGEAYLEAYHDDFDTSRSNTTFLRKALTQFKTAQLKGRQAEVLKMIGDEEQDHGNYALAMVALRESLELYQSIGVRSVQEVYDLLGRVSGVLGDYPGAVDYGLKAIKTAEQQNDTSLLMCTIYNHLGLTFNLWGKSDQALTNFKRSIDISLKYKDNSSILTLLFNICMEQHNLQKGEASVPLLKDIGGKCTLNNIEDSALFFETNLLVYTDVKNINAGEKYLHLLENILPNLDRQNVALMPVYTIFVYYLLAASDHKMAARYADEYLTYALQSQSPNIVASAYNMKAKVDSATGDFKSSLEHFKRSKLIRDSLFNENRTFQFAQMQVAYETEKKDKDIQILTQQDSLHQAQLTQTRITNYIIIGSAVALIILLALLYNRYRVKQRLNKALELKQEEVNEKNIRLEHLLKDKEWLLKEIHHRVKNNLQIIISLLNTQSSYLDNKEAIAAIAESKLRLQAIAIIHQKLYRAENSSTVIMKNYIHELAHSIQNCFPAGARIKFLLDIEEIELDINQAMPIGLIINETVTNAMKHAFDNVRSGNIEVSMNFIDGDKIRLLVKDDGKGLPAGFDISQTQSMGLLLIDMLAKQINGKIDITGIDGVSVVVEFTKDPVLTMNEQELTVNTLV